MEGEYEQVDITNFDLCEIEPGSKTLIIGRRGSGKTTFIDKILQSCDDETITNALIVSVSDYDNPYFSPKYPNARVIHKYSQNEVDMFLEKGGDFIVFDDCFAEYIWKTDPFLLKLLTNPKIAITIIVAVQYTLSDHQNLFSTFDHAFLFAEDYILNQKRLYKRFDQLPAIFEKFEHFSEVLKEVTKDYGALVLTKDSQKLMWASLHMAKVAYTKVHGRKRISIV